MEKNSCIILLTIFSPLFSVLSFLELLLFGYYILYPPLPFSPPSPLSSPSLSLSPPFPSSPPSSLLGDLVNFLFHALLDGTSLAAGVRDGSIHKLLLSHIRAQHKWSWAVFTALRCQAPEFLIPHGSDSKVSLSLARSTVFHHILPEVSLL